MYGVLENDTLSVAKKHLIIIKLFEFGGSNTHLQSLIRYFGRQNITLLLEDTTQLSYLQNIYEATGIPVLIKPRLHQYARLNHSSALSNIKEFALMLRSVLSIMLISIRNGFAHVTISAVEPEKNLYLLWIPFIRVTYILHSTPGHKITRFTAYTCNSTLGHKKNIITVSEANKAAIVRNWDIIPAKQKHIRVIYNCIADDQALTAKTSDTKKNIQTVLTMGHVIEYKNPQLWFNVAKQVTQKRNDATFIWLGNGPLFAELEKAARPYSRINFAGFSTDTAGYLKNAAVYYQPSLYETLGMAVIEAMSHHLPCVVTDVGGLPEVVKDRYNGLLVNPSDEDAHVNALLALLDNKELSKQFGQNGYQRYRDFFTYDTFKTKMDAIYSK